MKSHWILTVALAAAASLTAIAAAAGAPATAPAGHEGRKAFAERWANMGLNLTDEQKAKIKDIMAGARESFKAAADRQAKRKIMEDVRAQVRAILTPEQVAKLDQFKKDHPGMGRHGRYGGGAASQPTT